jgi:hypothetical protein
MTFGFDARGKLKGALAFVHHQAAGGLALLAAALGALIACNSPLAWLYDGFLHRWASASGRSPSTSRCCSGSTTA